MSSNVETKKTIVEEIKKKLENAQTIVLAEYRGITVDSMTKLRKNARNDGVYLKVLKNTLVRKAVAGTSFENLANDMVGPLIYAISNDPISAAKLLDKFSKEDNKIIIKAASYNGDLLDAKQTNELASIPSKKELLAKLLGIMQAPVSGFARALAALAAKKETEEA